MRKSHEVEQPTSNAVNEKEKITSHKRVVELFAFLRFIHI